MEEIIRSLTVAIYCNRTALQPLLKRQLEDEYTLLFCDTFENLSQLLKKHEIACIVAHPFHDGECGLWEFRGLKERFELIPLIITCPCDHFDFIGACAETFADDYVDLNEIDGLRERVHSAIDRYDFQKALAISTDTGATLPRRVKKALKLIHASFSKIKFAEDVSRQLGISVTTFRKEFRQAQGIPFTQYLIRIRLLYATYLARNDGLSGKNIAPYCGFNDEHEFYRSFKKKIGISFSEYRSKYSFHDFDQFYCKN